MKVHFSWMHVDPMTESEPATVYLNMLIHYSVICDSQIVSFSRKTFGSISLSDFLRTVHPESGFQTLPTSIFAHSNLFNFNQLVLIESFSIKRLSCNQWKLAMECALRNRKHAISSNLCALLADCFLANNFYCHSTASHSDESGAAYCRRFSPW